MILLALYAYAHLKINPTWRNVFEIDTFCFYCILQWSEVVQTCPLCKSEFTTIIHTVKSDKDYQMYQLSQSDKKKEEVIDDGAFRLDNRFRYRTTMTSGRPVRHQQSSSSRTSGVNGNASSSRYSQWGSTSTRRKPIYLRSLERRRAIYAASLWVKGVASNGKTKYRDISPEFFRRNPACTHRLIPWISRELNVVLGNSGDAAFIRQLILSIIYKVDILSDEFREQLSHFLYEKTNHFLHEFVNFARSPYDMFTYDKIARYDYVAPENYENPRREESESHTEDNQEQSSQRLQMAALSRTELDDSPIINHSETSSDQASNSSSEDHTRNQTTRSIDSGSQMISAGRHSVDRRAQLETVGNNSFDQRVSSPSASKERGRSKKKRRKHRHHHKSRHRRKHNNIAEMSTSDIEAELQRLDEDIKSKKSQLLQVMLNIESLSNK
ncbi:E3 ubiquitin-protein ligase Topors [Trichoplax sp. H2]|nr:E3 ubiquitin-protein ligase Topors [Trichoplax sp. H2]|eukprot:RDD37934.1 E3 ubiquitin-protein ligase Topors [Trichoplax sp. H2]